MTETAPGTPNPQSSLRSAVGALLRQAEADLEQRKQATRRRMEEIERRLKHVAYLIADLDLRFVIPKLTEFASLFPNAKAPRKDGLIDRIWVDFAPTPAYPAQARLAVGMAPNPAADVVRVTVSVSFVPVYLTYEHEAWLDIRVESPDTKSLEDFLDRRIVQFTKDYIRTGSPESRDHEDDGVTDPVCRMTFPVSEAETSTTYKNRTYYFCLEGCRRKFEAAPERYVQNFAALKDLPAHERSTLLDSTPAEIPKGHPPGARGQ